MTKSLKPIARQVKKLLASGSLSQTEQDLCNLFLKLSPETIASGICKECGQSVCTHEHSLSFHHVNALYRLYRRFGVKREFKLSSILKDRVILDNFQKLRYWGFVQKAAKLPNGKKRWSSRDTKSKTGLWRLTQLAEDFLLHGRKVAQSVRTYMGNTLYKSTVKVSAQSQLVGWLTHDDYKAKVKPILDFIKNKE